jgi:hypothetical protein
MSDSREAAHDYFNSPLQLQNPAVIHGGVFCALLDFFAPLRLGVSFLT